MVQTAQDSGGPRQPWHDLHCRIDGPAAYDVLTNFEQRWKKARRWHDDELIEIQRISWILGPSKDTPPQGDGHLMVTEDEDPETWHVQVFPYFMPRACNTRSDDVKCISCTLKPRRVNIGDVASKYCNPETKCH